MNHREAPRIAALALAAGLFSPLFTLSANAVLVDRLAAFTTGPTAKVTLDTTAVSERQCIDPPDQSNLARKTNANAADFFGIATWEVMPALQVDQDVPSGTWSIPHVDFATCVYIFVFNERAVTKLVAFLFNELASSGDRTTPVTDPPFSLTGGPHAGLHLSIFRTVPEPATLATLGTALVGQAVPERRRRVV